MNLNPFGDNKGNKDNQDPEKTESVTETESAEKLNKDGFIPGQRVEPAQLGKIRKVMEKQRKQLKPVITSKRRNRIV